MSARSNRWVVITFIFVSIAVVLACGVSVTSPQSSPAFDPTKAALEIQGTALALQLTEAALNAEEPAEPVNPPAEPNQPAPPAPAPVVEATPTPDIEARIRSAKILVYENTDERGIGMWIQEALDGMGLRYTQTGSYSGHFMEYLNSGVKYDLIIVGAEDKDKISGEFWDMINTRLMRDKAALIAEVWYLDREANGPIGKILAGCGIRFQKDMPVDNSVYWWVPDHPVFNEPNTVLPLIHYDLFWANQAGDRIMLGSGGDATLLAGVSARAQADESVLATCYQGRVIIQTFSDHDYHEADIIPLWQNYIHYTLSNHFAVTP